MTMKTLLRSTSKFRLCWTTKLPYPMSRSRTAMATAAGAGAEVVASSRGAPGSPGRDEPGGLGGRPEPPMNSDLKDIEDHRDDALGHDDEHDGRHHGRGGGQADRSRAASRLHPAQAPGERDQNAEDGALDDAEKEVGESEG